MPSARVAATAAVVALTTQTSTAIDNGLGLKPPMGWRSWNLYGADVNQSLLQKIMDGMVAKTRFVNGQPTSLCDLGYCDVGLDDNWQSCGAGADGYNYHNHEGMPVVNLKRFPNMTAMTEHAHELGLTAGWYHNNCICNEKKVATREMYEQDVYFLTEVFQFDGVKLDGCGTQRDLNLWSSLINKTGRKVMIENCHWGGTVPIGSWCPWNFFRTSGDVRATYGSIVGNLQTTILWADTGLSRPGCWGYPDMLEVGCAHGPGGAGDPGLTLEETRSHFGAWCIVSSPLTLSHDVNNETIMDKIWPVIANTEAIAVNQAWAGHSGSPFKKASTTIELSDSSMEDGILTTHSWPLPSWQYFSKPLGGGEVAVLLMNHASTPINLTLTFADVPGLECKASCGIRDIWAHANVPSQGVSHTFVAVQSHDSVFLVLSSKAGVAKATEQQTSQWV